MSSEILINSNLREIRVALIENNQLAELFVEHRANKGIVGNIYKGKVTKILPGMQVAFVDIGLDKAGFLCAADIDISIIPDSEKYLPKKNGLESVTINSEEEDAKDVDASEQDQSIIPIKHNIPIQNLLKEGQEVIVQVAKTTVWVKKPKFHTRSILLRNLNAAANSRNPMTTLTEFNQPPDWGILARYCGNKARKKNGVAKAVLKMTIPNTGQNHCPCDAATSNNPRN